MPDQADRGVVRFRARRAVEHLIEVFGGELGKLARQGDDRRVRRLEEGVVERKVYHLVVSRLRERLAPIADVASPQSRHAVENALAFAVPDIGAVAAHDDARAGRPERTVSGEGMKMVKSVELLQLRGLILIRHLKNLQQSVTQGPSN